METKSVYNPSNPSHQLHELRFANAALLNASIAFSKNPTDNALLLQLQLEADNVERLRSLDPLLGGRVTLSDAHG